MGRRTQLKYLGGAVACSALRGLFGGACTSGFAECAPLHRGAFWCVARQRDAALTVTWAARCLGRTDQVAELVTSKIRSSEKFPSFSFLPHTRLDKDCAIAQDSALFLASSMCAVCSLS